MERMRDGLAIDDPGTAVYAVGAAGPRPGVARGRIGWGVGAGWHLPAGRAGGAPGLAGTVGALAGLRVADRSNGPPRSAAGSVAPRRGRASGGGLSGWAGAHRHGAGLFVGAGRARR